MELLPTGYFVRIVQKEGYVALIKGLGEVSDYTKILCVLHKGDKADPHEHYHISIATECKEKAFRKRMTGIFDKGKGNGHMSIKKWDGRIQANSYMFHEDGANANIIVSKGYSQEDISSFVKENAEVQKLVDNAKEKASWKLEALAEKWFRDNGDTHNICLFEIGVKIYEIALEKEMYVPQDWLLKSMCVKILYKLADESHKQHMISECVKKALRLD